MFQESKRKWTLALVLLVAILFFTGCDFTPSSSAPPASKPTPTHSSSSPFVVINEWDEERTCGRLNAYTHHAIMVHNTTKVMYHFSVTGSHTGGTGTTFNVLLDAQGNPMIYDGQIKDSDENK